MPVFPEGFQQSWLWDDPLAPDPAVYFGAVLRAEEIRRYVTDYNLLIDKMTYRAASLKGASYTMSPHSTEGWIINDAGGHELLLRRQNSRGGYYVVPRNSLVYIRLREVLRLPFYIIGRHNLKIDYVYQGLLLGTGPQVDPGFTGQIYIPLHNLTNQQVDIYIDESFVSIDFVRTGPLTLEKGVPESFDEFYAMYKLLKRPIDLEKLDQKTNLPAYLQGNRPSSSLGNLVPRVEKLASDMRRRRWIEVGIFLTVLAFLITVLTTYYFHFDDQLTRKTADATKRIDDLQKGFESSRGDISSLRFENGAKETERQIQALRNEIAALKAEMTTLKTPAQSATPTKKERR
jgi:deoxycytidine triphosphate deaminase